MVRGLQPATKGHESCALRMSHERFLSKWTAKEPPKEHLKRHVGFVKMLGSFESKRAS